MTSTIAVGLIINPMAGRDIRRLVAYASLQSQPEKAQAARRIAAGLAAVPGVSLLVPEDRGGFSPWLKEELAKIVSVDVVPHPPVWEDTTALWVDMLVRSGAQALIVVGGDGTQRNVAQAAPPVPVLPIAGGTNNVACFLGDQTAAGYAVGQFLRHHMDLEQVAQRAKILHVDDGSGQEELALIDVALTRQNFTGALAVWDPNDVRALVLARAQALRPGLSNVGGYLRPVAFSDDLGLTVRLGRGGARVPVVLAPGLMESFLVKSFETLAFDKPVRLRAERHGGSLALDGERTVVLSPNHGASVTLRRDGPWTLDPERILGELRFAR
jgi:hypothetical protein